MAWDEDGDPVVVGCARYWGHLACDAACEVDAAIALDALGITVALECPDDVNPGAPQSREG